MTKNEIREVVKLTIEELDRRGRLKKLEYQDVLKVLDNRLYKFFNSTERDKSLSYALRQIADDSYIDIIYLQYRDKQTIEAIAEYFEKDVSTIKRNKKRLMLSLYELVEV